MGVLEWVLTFALFTIYLACLVTVCVVTFRKGRYVLGVVGIVLPILWLIGAVLPARAGSAYAKQEAARDAPQVEETPG